MEELPAAHEALKVRLQEQEHELHELRSALKEKTSEAEMALSLGTLLHSIGNAMTPVKVYVEKLDLKRLELMSHYLEKSFSELVDHRGDLQRFIDEDERGKAVFSYLVKLVPSIRKYVEEKIAMQDKVVSGVDRVLEVLGVQQRMGSAGREPLDVNLLIRDVVLIQTSSLSKRGIGVRLDLAQNLPWVIAERAGLMHVLISLIKNACESLVRADDAASVEKEIAVQSCLEAHQVKVEILYEGSGSGLIDAHGRGAGEPPQTPEGSLIDACASIIADNGGTLLCSCEMNGQITRISLALPRVPSRSCP